VDASLFVIIDGNNLAKYLYALDLEAPVTLETDRQLVAHLSGWAARQARPLVVELCLDPRYERPADQGRVQVYVATAPESGDDAVLDRVRVHVVNGEDCLVISNDQELCAQAGEFQVDTWSVSGFVRRRDARHPVFAPAPRAVKAGKIPGEQPVGRSTPASSLPAAAPSSFRQRVGQFAGQVQARRRQEQIDQAIARTLTGQNTAAGAPDSSAPASSAVPPALPSHYRLTLETWPVSQGARFLSQSFCPFHWAEVAPLVGPLASLQAADLPVLAGLLLDCCGQESDFVRRGGSLMDRVRLALLQAGPGGLSLPELVRLTGAAPAALERKLHRSEGKWLRVGTPSSSAGL